MVDLFKSKFEEESKKDFCLNSFFIFFLTEFIDYSLMGSYYN